MVGVSIAARCLLALTLVAALSRVEAKIDSAQSSVSDQAPCPFLCLDPGKERDTTLFGAPLSATICRVLEGQAYRFALGYQDYWTRKTSDLDQCEAVDFVAFSFMSGSGAYPRYNRLNYAAYFICGGDVPCSQLEYSVSVILKRNAVTDPNYYRMPSRVWANIIDTKEQMKIVDTPFGLKEVVYPVFRQSDRNLYRSDDDMEVLLYCSRVKVQPINPSCAGHYYFKEEKLFFFYNFPAERLQDWQKIAEEAKDLITGWRK